MGMMMGRPMTTWWQLRMQAPTLREYSSALLTGLPSLLGPGSNCLGASLHAIIHLQDMLAGFCALRSH